MHFLIITTGKRFTGQLYVTGSGLMVVVVAVVVVMTMMMIMMMMKTTI